jgi:hypothetical protein
MELVPIVGREVIWAAISMNITGNVQVSALFQQHVDNKTWIRADNCSSCRSRAWAMSDSEGATARRQQYDDDETEEDDIDGFVNAVGKPLFPAFPLNLSVREFAFHQNRAAAGPATITSSPAYNGLSGSSKRSPIQPERRGKLPSVTKIKERLAQSAFRPGVLPAKSTSTTPMEVSGAKKDRRATHDGNAPAIDNGEARHSREKTFASATQNSQRSAKALTLIQSRWIC